MAEGQDSNRSGRWPGDSFSGRQEAHNLLSHCTARPGCSAAIACLE